MTTETDKNDNKLSAVDVKVMPKISPGCAPGCACEKPAGKGTTKLKIVVCLVVVVAVGGILISKK